ncbi:MAG: DNA alkylation response protein, partial [Solirubrobacterales bacterium]
MATVESSRGVHTHDVANQPPPLEDYNVFEADTVLVEAVEREGAGWARDRISAVGALAGSAEIIRMGAEANENPP